MSAAWYEHPTTRELKKTRLAGLYFVIPIQLQAHDVGDDLYVYAWSPEDAERVAARVREEVVL